MMSHTTGSASRPADVPADEAPPGPHHRASRLSLAWWQAAVAGAVVATVVNLLVFGVANAAGAELVLDQSTNPHPITVGGVVFSSTVPMVGGILLAALLSRFWSGFLRLAQVVGGALAVITTAGPLISEADGATRAALAIMHLVVGVVVVLALEALRRRRTRS